MKILTAYIHALNRNDLDGITSLFTEDCVFLDKAPRLMVGGDVCAKGREAVRTFFEALFREHAVAAALLVDMGDRALYNVTLDRTTLHCIGRIQQSQNKIQRMEIDQR